jgi:hypothetical protein
VVVVNVEQVGDVADRTTMIAMLIEPGLGAFDQALVGIGVNRQIIKSGDQFAEHGAGAESTARSGNRHGDGILVPVGDCALRYRQVHGDASLFTDNRHPTSAGTYFSAYVFVGALFGTQVMERSAATPRMDDVALGIFSVNRSELGSATARSTRAAFTTP